MKRKITNTVSIGNVSIGGTNKIAIQSMTNTRTRDVTSTVNQINDLASAGCEIVRIAVLNMEDAVAIGSIKEQIQIPLVADIHYDYRLAIEAVNQGIDKLRINPANLKNKEHIKEIVNLCKVKQIPIRIGVNSGSFKNHDNVVDKMIEYAQDNIDLLNELEFKDIVLSFKSSNLATTIEVNEIASSKWDYPLHIGVTEAGTEFSGGIKNAIGIGILLNKGIGDTLRVSITGDPVKEIKYCKEILKNFGLYDSYTLISCPTCGRLQYDMVEIAEEIEEYMQKSNKRLTLAIMGCSVNGPGEAKQADLALIGGVNEVLFVKDGIQIRKIKENIVAEFIKEIEAY